MEFTETNSSENSWQIFMGTGEQVCLSLVGILMGIVGGLGNGVVVALVCCSPAMRSAINLLLATLALTDTMLLLLTLPLDVVTLIGRGWILPVSLCYAHQFLLTVMHLQGVVILTVICIDRYVIIVYQQGRLTPSMASWIIAGSWVLSIGLALPPLVGLGTHVSLPLEATLTHCLWTPTRSPSISQMFYGCVIFMFVYLLPLITMSACFGSILVKVHKNSSKVNTNKEAGTNNNDVVHSSPHKEDAKTTSHRRPLVALDLCYKTRTFTTILMLFLVFVVCRSPLHLAQLAKVFIQDEHKYFQVHIWLLWWAYIQPAVNPVIYTVRIKKFREELIEYFPCLLRLVPGPSSNGYRRSDPKAIYMIHDPGSSSSN